MIIAFRTMNWRRHSDDGPKVYVLYEYYHWKQEFKFDFIRAFAIKEDAVKYVDEAVKHAFRKTDGIDEDDDYHQSSWAFGSGAKYDKRIDSEENRRYAVYKVPLQPSSELLNKDEEQVQYNSTLKYVVGRH